jgi:putative AlgH/UPF0301 family transcriptional regulator
MDVRLTSDMPAKSYGEARVRYIMADMTLGGPVSYYRGYVDTDENAAEAVSRWDDGVRVTNSGSFGRKIVGGSWQIVYDGTERTIDGMDVRLTSDMPAKSYGEARVRYIMADMSLGGPVSYYRSYVETDAHAAEAVRRWDDNIRVTNVSSFERKRVKGSWEIVYEGTERTIDGMDVRLTSGSGHHSNNTKPGDASGL